MLQGDEGHLFGKIFHSHIIEIEHSKKVFGSFKGNNEKNTPFQKGPPPYKIDHKVEGDTITGQNQVIKTKTKMFDFKTTQVQVRRKELSKK